MKPCEIKGDFDGDGKQDRAVLVENGSQKGIQFKFATGSTALIGAGENIGSSGADMEWMDHWHLYKGKIEQGATKTNPPPNTKGDSILVEKSASASGVVYWDGSKLKWYQQGD